MLEKQGPSIQIQQMNMRINGQSPETAHRVAQSLGHALARVLPGGEARHYGSLNVRVPVASNASDSEISMAVADAIARILQKERKR
jgi:hypothetical protein